MKFDKEDRSSSDLRSLAEERLQKRKAEIGAPPIAEDYLKLIHEMHVHQIELEMQNEELIQARAEIEASLEKYSDLYDFAPVGYFTLSNNGIIREVNLTGAALLDKERSHVVDRHFSSFLSPEAHFPFNDFLGKVFEDTTRKTCEVMLADNNITPRYLHIEGTAVNAGKDTGRQCRMVCVDISDRIRAEEELKVSLTKYQVLFDSFPHGITISDKDGTIVEANKKAETLLGLSKEEHLHRMINGKEWSIIRADGSPMTGDEYASTLALKENRIVENVEMGIVKGAKEITWLNVTAAPIPSNEFGVAITYSDITERKIMEEALREKNVKMDSIFRVAPTGIGLVSNRILVEVNQRICEMTGYSRDELVGKSARMLYSTQEDFDFVGNEKYRQIQSQGTGSVETKWRRKDGMIIDIILSSCPVDTENLSAGVTFAALDISERKHVEEELSRYREHLEDLVKERTIELKALTIELHEEVTQHKQTVKALRKSATDLEDLYNNAPCGYHSLDSDGFFIRINDTELRWLGYSRKEMIGKLKFFDMLTDASKKTSQETFPRFKVQGRISDLEFDMIRKDGTIMPVLLNATAIKDSSGSFVISRSTLFDMTTLKQTEEEKRSLGHQLAQAQKMEALGRFAGGIAHDMNNMLYPVLVNTQMLLEESLPGSPEHQSLTMSLTAICRQRDLIKQILSFSRKEEQRFVPVQIKPLMKETLDMLRSLIPSTIRIKQSLEGYRDVVMGNPTQIQQIIMNLCKNAADALPSQKGRIDVTLGNVSLDLSQGHPDIKAGDYLSLAVKDTGSGMTPEILNHIFEPFFTTKDAGKGTGMGLAVIHGIVLAHGGAIIAESEPERGTQFTVYIPLINEESQAMRTGPGTAHQLNKGIGKILLVDDEVIILESVRRVLNNLGYEVVTGINGHEAIEVFSKMPESFDLVITDMAMPEMTGMELAAKLVEIRPGIPIILCSGFSDAVDSQTMIDLGICRILDKPADIDELKNAIDHALDPDP